LDKILIVYHLHQVNNWEQLLSEQMGMLLVSGLFEAAHEIYISVNDTKYIPTFHEKVKVVYNPGYCEKPSMLLAYNLAKENPESKIFFFGSKGASKPSYYQDDWRLMMNHWTIMKWRVAVDKLNEVDTFGASWHQSPLPHYSGTHWWSTAKYLSSLDPAYLSESDRWSHEFWIGTGVGMHCCPYDSRVDHYSTRFPISEYTSEFFR